MFRNFASPKIIIGLALAVLLGVYFVFFYEICVQQVESPKGGGVEIDGGLYVCETLFQILRGRSEPLSPPQPSGQTVDTSDWKTYRNGEYGFVIFRYPPDWIVRPEYYRSPAQEAAGEPATVVALVLAPPSGAANAPQDAIIVGGRQFDCSIHGGEQTRCLTKFGVDFHTQSHDHGILNIFDLLITTVEERR